MANTAIIDGLDLIGQFIVDQLVKTLDDLGHRATGQLQDTMRSVVTVDGKGFDITIYGKDYAKFVESGVPSGVWVSVEALAKWVEAKGIATGEPQIKSLAFAIQRKIFNEGSVQFRENKKGFVDVMLDESANLMFQMVFDLFTREVSLSLSETIGKNSKIFQS